MPFLHRESSALPHDPVQRMNGNGHAEPPAHDGPMTVSFVSVRTALVRHPGQVRVPVPLVVAEDDPIVLSSPSQGP